MSGTADTPSVKTPEVKKFTDTTPSNWVITSVGKEIEAYSSVTGETFKGPMNEFNKRLHA